MWKHVGTQKISTQRSKLNVDRYMHPRATGIHKYQVNIKRNVVYLTVNTKVNFMNIEKETYSDNIANLNYWILIIEY